MEEKKEVRGEGKAEKDITRILPSWGEYTYLQNYPPKTIKGKVIRGIHAHINEIGDTLCDITQEITWLSRFDILAELDKYNVGYDFGDSGETLVSLVVVALRGCGYCVKRRKGEYWVGKFEMNASSEKIVSLKENIHEIANRLCLQRFVSVRGVALIAGFVGLNTKDWSSMTSLFEDIRKEAEKIGYVFTPMSKYGYTVSFAKQDEGSVSVSEEIFEPYAGKLADTIYSAGNAHIQKMVMLAEKVGVSFPWGVNQTEKGNALLRFLKKSKNLSVRSLGNDCYNVNKILL